MMRRTAQCRCGAIKLECAGDPVRISVCHCLECKRRSGSAFTAQARFPADRVAIEGTANHWRYVGDSGSAATFHFCGVCGTNLWYRADAMPELIAVAIGAFADPGFSPPHYSVFEDRRHDWVQIVGEGIAHID